MLETICGNYTIKQIFQDKDNWKNFVIKNKSKLRSSIIEEVEKVLNCRDPFTMGYHLYRCLVCNKIERIVPHSCKSRFCSSCGKVATDNWINKAMSRFLNVPYHHIVFTLPEEIKKLCLYDRSLLNILFKAASLTVLEWCKENGGYIPGVVCILHTFGSTLNFNPHIHMLITEGGLKSDTKDTWVHNEFIPWNMLKARWKYHVITLFKPELKQLILLKKAGREYDKLGVGSSFRFFLEQFISKDLVCVYGGQANQQLFYHTLYRTLYQKTCFG